MYSAFNGSKNTKNRYRGGGNGNYSWTNEQRTLCSHDVQLLINGSRLDFELRRDDSNTVFMFSVQISSF